jgi:hypothetical protein
MKAFIEKYQSAIKGAISGFDRVLFRGTLRRISSVHGLSTYLSYTRILLKDFKTWANDTTQRIRQESEAVAQVAGRPVCYLNSSGIDKEDYARGIAQRDGIKDGLVCLLTAVEPCMSFDIHKNREKKKLELVARERKCLWIYHYMIHPLLGFMHARIQTWVPFTIKICINGREWLSRQMDNARLGYVRRANCFTDLKNIAVSQQLMDTQIQTDWPKLLNSIQKTISPAHDRLFAHYPLPYYWSADESEWATDIMFKSQSQLANLYPRLINHGIRDFGSTDVMRFLGQANRASSGIHSNFKGQIVTDIKNRPEGMRIKHRINRNHIKMYDKEGSVLRVETTINNTREFKVYRRANDDPKQKLSWQKMRKGVADLHRRAKVSQASNNRYLQALSSVDLQATVEEQLQPLCRKVVWNNKNFRAINPWSTHDRALLAAINRGEFSINGFRNRDILGLVYHQEQDLNQLDRKRTSARVSRNIRLLRAHGLIHKVTKSNRYVLSEKGRTICASLSTVNASKISDLYKKAA